LPLVPAGRQRSVKASTTIQTREVAEIPQGARHHIVQEGETLFNLAQRYYNDGDKSGEIYRVNRNVLKTPDALPPGTVLVIPDLTSE
jgi:nucleoid-associated protein YgaU